MLQSIHVYRADYRNRFSPKRSTIRKNSIQHFRSSFFFHHKLLLAVPSSITIRPVHIREDTHALVNLSAEEGGRVA